MLKRFQRKVHQSRWIHWLWPWMVVGLLSSCASMSSDVSKTTWSCDRSADVAVQQEQWQQAVQGHLKLIQENPSNCLAIYHLGYIWGRQGDPEKEIAFYQKAITCGYTHDDQFYFNLGMAYVDLHQMDKALEAFNHTVMINPKNPEGHFGIGMVAQTKGDTFTAEKALVKAVAMDPQHWDARMLLCKIYLDQGRMEAVRPHLQMLLKYIPENEEAQALWHVYQDRRVTGYDQTH